MLITGELTIIALALNLTHPRLAALGAHQLHVRGVQRRLPLDHAALDLALRIRLGVALDEVHALDHHAVLLGQHLEHASLLAAVLARHHRDGVVLLDRCR